MRQETSKQSSTTTSEILKGTENPVNDSIGKTLDSPTPELFTVLNNGITVVATSAKSAGNHFTIFDYQIVNGCQTSNVLFRFVNDSNLENLHIPINLIITDDEEVKTKSLLQQIVKQQLKENSFKR